MKYLVEGGMNFFDELNKPEVKQKVDTPVCLITDEPLVDLSVELNCGHSFNYEPLYKEVCLQKTGKNYLEISKLSFNEMKCPYCRKIQRGLLPFHELLEKTCPKLYGVNSLTNSAPIAKTVIANNTFGLCTQLLKTGVNKGSPCGKHIFTNTAGLCTRHYNLSLKVVNPVPTTEPTIN
jgi:hypothetical protein